jgi:hypothetical protein
MNFSSIKTITIPEGNVVRIKHGETVLWQAADQTSVNAIDTSDIQTESV